MKRREFISLLGGAATWPLAAHAAADVSRVWRVGFLSPSPPDIPSSSLLEAFRLRLSELGYIEGQNLILDVRRADGNLSLLPRLAAELVATRPDVIFASVTPAVSAVQQATTSIPIVMGPTASPVGSGFVKSLAKPGGNITGVSLMSFDLSAKQFEFLTTIAPTARRIAVLMSANPVHASLMNEALAAAQVLGLTVVPVTAERRSDLDDAFATMTKENCNGLVVLADPVNARIAELAFKARLPAVHQFSDFVRFGGLLSYGPNLSHLFRRAADYVDRILKGANPAELPVEQPTKFDLVINLKTAKALGLEIPPTLLARADEVIE